MHLALFLYRAPIILLHLFIVILAVYHIDAFDLKAILPPQKTDESAN
jgi:hypothetical protein